MAPSQFYRLFLRSEFFRLNIYKLLLSEIQDSATALVGNCIAKGINADKIDYYLKCLDGYILNPAMQA